MSRPRMTSADWQRLREQGHRPPAAWAEEDHSKLYDATQVDRIGPPEPPATATAASPAPDDGPGFTCISRTWIVTGVLLTPPPRK